MTELNETEIRRIDVLLSQLSHSSVRTELLDHYCCLVEVEMTRGRSFEEALTTLQKSFTEQEAEQIEQGYLKLGTHGNHLVRRAMSIAAMLVFLVVAGVDAQKRPTLSPVKSDDHLALGFGIAHTHMGKEIHHRGIDLKTPIGTPVHATADGYIHSIRNSAEGHGLHVIIQHADGYETLYANLNTTYVKEGESVLAGEKIALSGNSGASSIPHLHYEIRHNHHPVNPEEYITE